MTNADKIRAMTDEELAKFLCQKTKCHICYGEEYCSFGQNGLLEWLKQEAET